MSTSTDEMWKRDEAHIREAMARQASSAEAPVENAGPVSSFALARGSNPAPAKGEKHGTCNRGACNNTNALWWNRSTERYYCKPCARRIMSYPENAGLLTVTEPESNNKVTNAPTSAR